MPKIQGTFINCIILSLTQPTAQDTSTLAIHSKAADKLARRVATWSLSCSTAVKQGVPCKNLAAPMLVIRKSGIKTPLACIADTCKNAPGTSLHCDEIT